MHLPENVLDDIADIAHSYYQDRPVDYEDLYDRIEMEMGIDLPEDLLDPVFGQIKRHVRRARKETQG